MLEFQQDDNRPRVVPDHPKDLNERRVAFTERCTPAIILSAISEMDAGNPCVVAFEKAEAILVGSRKMTNVQRGLEVHGETETFYNTSFSVEGIRVRKVVMVVQSQEHRMPCWKWR